MRLYFLERNIRECNERMKLSTRVSLSRTIERIWKIKIVALSPRLRRIVQLRLNDRARALKSTLPTDTFVSGAENKTPRRYFLRLISGYLSSIQISAKVDSAVCTCDARNNSLTVDKSAMSSPMPSPRLGLMRIKATTRNALSGPRSSIVGVTSHVQSMVRLESDSIQVFAFSLKGATRQGTD